MRCTVTYSNRFNDRAPSPRAELINILLGVKDAKS